MGLRMRPAMLRCRTDARGDFLVALVATATGSGVQCRADEHRGTLVAPRI
jgi:hypothetical protein